MHKSVYFFTKQVLLITTTQILQKVASLLKKRHILTSIISKSKVAQQQKVANPREKWKISPKKANLPKK